MLKQLQFPDAEKRKTEKHAKNFAFYAICPLRKLITNFCDHVEDMKKKGHTCS